MRRSRRGKAARSSGRRGSSHIEAKVGSTDTVTTSGLLARLRYRSAVLRIASKGPASSAASKAPSRDTSTERPDRPISFSPSACSTCLTWNATAETVTLSSSAARVRLLRRAADSNVRSAFKLGANRPWENAVFLNSRLNSSGFRRSLLCLSEEKAARNPSAQQRTERCANATRSTNGTAAARSTGR